MARENDLRERIPHTCPSSHEDYFNLFLVLCHTAWLFQGRNLIGRLEWRHVILNLAGNSFHCRSRTASDVTFKLAATFVDESKDFYVEKSGQSSCRRAKRSWLVGVRRRKRFRLGENCLLRSSLHQYINNQHPIAKNDNCLFRRHPRTPASCDTVVWIQPWTRNEKIGSKWVQT